MRVRARVTNVALGLIATGVFAVGNSLGAAIGNAQEHRSLDDGPRFLLAVEGRTTPVEVEVSRVPLLRRQVSLTLTDALLPDALKALKRVAGVEFVYSPGAINQAKRVTLQAGNMTVAAILTDLLIDAQVDVLLSGRTYVTLVPRRAGRSVQGKITGRVSDVKTGNGVGGVEVWLNETKWRTASDSVGRYLLIEVDPGTYTLTARRLGYTKQSRKVTVRAEREDTVDVALEPMATKLDELVTTATGPQRRRDLGNAITTIKADSVMRTAPIRNLTDLLDTRVPGLTVQRTSGAPGDPAKLRLRGLSSVNRSNDPVVVVDGVRIYAVQSDKRSGNLTNLNRNPHIGHGNPVDVPAPSPLDQIDPNSIETIEVFKGPSAATLYGADAANGVIVITTKRGKAGPTQWQGSVTRGRTTQPGDWPVGYYRWGHNLFFGGALQACTLLNPYCIPDSLVRFQALNEPSLTLLGQGDRTALSLTASGGSQGLQFRVTGTYQDEFGLLAMPEFEVERFQTRFDREAPAWMRRPHHYTTWDISSNLTANLSPTLDVSLLTSLSRSEQQRTTLEGQLTGMVGTYVDTINGKYYRPTLEGFAIGRTENLLAGYYTRQTASTLTLRQGLNAQWRPRSWFNASAVAGLEVVPRHDASLLPSYLDPSSSSRLGGGAVSRGTGRSVQSNFSLQGTVRKPIGRGFVFLTNVGANVSTSSTTDLVTAATGLVRGTNSTTGASSVSTYESVSDASVFGWYVEPSISGERLSLSTGLRLDGGNTYGTRLSTSGSGPAASGRGFLRGLFGSLLALPKLNGSWVISEEPFFPFKTLFSSLRLRGAYGQSQVQPGPTDRLRIYSDSGGGRGLLLAGLGNTQLRPERGTELEAGVDADLFDARLSMEVTAYRKVQVDALMPVQLPPSVHGGGTQLINLGNIRNVGLELTVGVTPVQSSLVTWRTQVTYSRNRNTLTKLGNDVLPNKVAGIVEGYPLYSRWARPILGYADQDGDQVISSGEVHVGDSLVFVGRLQPAYTSGLTTDAQFFGGALSFSAGFSYTGGAVQVNQTARANWVLAPELSDPSTPLVKQATVVAAARAVDPTDYGLMQEVSTLRFNSMAVNYRVPQRVARLLGAQQAFVALQGSNLGLHTNYRGKDPNVNAWSPGEKVVDAGQLPQPRTWQLNIALQY